MTVQTTYTKNIRQAISGQVAYDFGTADITSHNAEAEIFFGNSVIKGAADNSVIVGNTTDLVLGFAVRSLLNDSALVTGSTSYIATETVPVMREGYIFVTNDSPATTLVEGEDVFLNAAGLLVATGDGGAVQLVGSRIEQGAAATGICLLRVQINYT